MIFVWIKLKEEKLREKEINTRRKLDKKKEFYLKFPNKHPNVRCSNNESYPEKFLKMYLIENKLNENVDFFKNYKIGKYYVDFYFPSINVGIEVDGEYWHNIKNNKEKEKERELFLKNEIELIRFQSKQLVEKTYQNDILEIINKIRVH